MAEYKMVPIEKLFSREKQVRQEFDEEFIEELAISIKKEGMLVPIIVRSVKEGYEIIAGEQRWRAGKKAKIREVPVSIINVDDKKLLELALLENVKRKDLQGWEREDAIFRMWDSGYYKSFDDLAKALDFKVTHLKDILKSRELREEEDLPRGASTRMITAISGLDKDTRKVILDAQEKGTLAKDVHRTTELLSGIRHANVAARPRLVQAVVKQDFKLDEVEEIANTVQTKEEVEQIIDAKKNLSEREFHSVLSYVKKERDSGRTPVIKTVITGDIKTWNMYLNTVESAKSELLILTPRKCAGWDVEHRRQLKQALLAIEKHVQDMLNALEDNRRD